jgi:hypothetical protein
MREKADEAYAYTQSVSRKQSGLLVNLETVLLMQMTYGGHMGKRKPAEPTKLLTGEAGSPDRIVFL